MSLVARLTLAGILIAVPGCASLGFGKEAGTEAESGPASTEGGQTSREDRRERPGAPGQAAGPVDPALAARSRVVSPPYVEIWIDTRERALGAYTLTLHYDPQFLHVQDVGTGDLSKFPDLPRANPATYSSGATTIAGFQTAGLSPTGRTRIATIFFTSAGPGVSPLRATLDTLVDPEGNPIPGDVLLSTDRVEALR